MKVYLFKPNSDVKTDKAKVVSTAKKWATLPGNAPKTDNVADHAATSEEAEIATTGDETIGIAIAMTDLTGKNMFMKARQRSRLQRSGQRQRSV